MFSPTGGGVPADLIESLRANPLLASVSDEAIGKIAELVAAETSQQVGAALRGVELFAGLTDDDLERIQGVAEPLVRDAGAELLAEGDGGDRLYVVVRGAVEVTGSGEHGDDGRVVEAGQALGYAALFGGAPSDGSARVREHSYLVGISRDALLELIGTETLAARLLRNVGSALGRRLPGAAPAAGYSHASEPTPRAALAEYNRMVRGRLIPRGLPSLPAHDLAARTVTDDEGEAAALWDWFLMSDGRLALTVLKVDQPGLSNAHRLLQTRSLLRDFAQDPVPGLGALLGRVNRGLRAGWVEGVSGSVSCGVLAVTDDGVEWAAAGNVGGSVVRSDASHEDLVPDAPSLGSDEELEYRGVRIRLAPGDHVLVFSEGPSDAVILGRKFLAAGGRDVGAERRIEDLLERVRASAAAVDGGRDVTVALVTRRGEGSGERPAGSDAIARAAAAFDQTVEEGPGAADQERSQETS